MPKFIDLTGQKFGKLFVLNVTDRIGSTGEHFWNTKCDCGNYYPVRVSALRNGHTKSCGCIHKNGTFHIHDMSKSKIFRVWIAMKQRCSNKRNLAHKYYGGRGIKVCDRWVKGENGLRGFQCFISDMGECPVGLTLDRIDNNGNYEPGNCRWSTRKEQQTNRRNNKKIDWNGEKLTISQICEREGAVDHVVRRRFDRGWDLIMALKTPTRKYRN